MGTAALFVCKPTRTKPPASCSLSPVFLMSSARDLTRLPRLHHHLPSIQLLHQFRTTIQILGRPTWGGYGVNKDPYCHKVEKVIFENKCEPYTEKTCWTQNQETCQPELFKNCTGVIQT